MSATDRQSAPSKHLRTYPRDGSATSMTADPDRNEYFCADCGRRVTVSLDNSGNVAREYGHVRRCEHSIERADQ